MNRGKFICELQDEEAFLYLHQTKNAEDNTKWIKHVFFLLKRDANIVFDEHDAQLKAKDVEIAGLIERVDCIRELNEINEQIIINKDAEIAELKKECEYDQRNASMSQKESVLLLEEIKAKDTELIKLKEDIRCAKEVIDWHEKECKKYIKNHHQLSRSIVAMLFWEFNKNRTRYRDGNKYYSYDMVSESYLLFVKAHRMLKERK